tara:strand:- start:1963 stop:2226 length:264 start_codon:yes stop_codon:yes gene_type:complete
MTDLKIEKNVPMPEKQGRRISKYPEHYELLDNMQVGDSVLFSLDDCKQNSNTNKRVSSFIQTANNIFKYKMSARKLGGATVRVWRVA